MQSNTCGSIACEMANKSRMFHKKKTQLCVELSKQKEWIHSPRGNCNLLIQCISLYTSLCLSNLCLSARKEKWKDSGRGTNAVFVFLRIFCEFFYTPQFVWIRQRYWSPMGLCSGAGVDLTACSVWLINYNIIMGHPSFTLLYLQRDSYVIYSLSCCSRLCVGTLWGF